MAHVSDEFNNTIELLVTRVEIDADDFNIMKILISERFCKLNCKINTGKEDEVNMNGYEIIKKLYYKYCK